MKTKYPKEVIVTNATSFSNTNAVVIPPASFSKTRLGEPIPYKEVTESQFIKSITVKNPFGIIENNKFKHFKKGDKSLRYEHCNFYFKNGTINHTDYFFNKNYFSVEYRSGNKHCLSKQKDLQKFIGKQIIAISNHERNDEFKFMNIEIHFRYMADGKLIDIIKNKIGNICKVDHGHNAIGYYFPEECFLIIR